ncbi:hypothetical protein [Actinomadura sp. 3N407]|uniref:hypothetical protein n=1 Tax=Actinomadura sp. 3N407 TaxID=3457423 RepID=UPI003FCDA6FB
MSVRLSDRQREVLRAIADGNVRDRRHLACGWATRRVDQRSSGRGGGLGMDVGRTVEALRRRGLAERGERIAEGPDIGEYPWKVTDAGREALKNSQGSEAMTDVPPLPIRPAMGSPEYRIWKGFRVATIHLDRDRKVSSIVAVAGRGAYETAARILDTVQVDEIAMDPADEYATELTITLPSSDVHRLASDLFATGAEIHEALTQTIDLLEGAQ